MILILCNILYACNRFMCVMDGLLFGQPKRGGGKYQFSKVKQIDAYVYLMLYR